MNIFLKSLIVSVSVASLAVLAVPSAHATNQATCVDGSVRSNLAVTWNSSDNVTVDTVGNKPLCTDTTIYFSSYTMPDNYNGKAFSNNPTASPQAIFDTTSTVLTKGATKPVTMSIKLPEACKNVQVDTYYGPEITTVTAAGHGSQYITGKILPKTVDTCAPVTSETPPVTPPVVPTPEAQTPPTPAPEVVVTPQAPAELPHTGSSTAAIVATSAALSVMTYAGVLVASKRR